MTNAKWALGLILLLTLGTDRASAGSDLTKLPYWNLDLTQVKCEGVGGISLFSLDGSQERWIRSEHLTHLMSVLAPASKLYPSQVVSAVYVNLEGELVFLGITPDSGLTLMKFSIGKFAQADDELELRGSRAVHVSADLRTFGDAFFTCVRRAD